MAFKINFEMGLTGPSQSDMQSVKSGLEKNLGKQSILIKPEIDKASLASFKRELATQIGAVSVPVTIKMVSSSAATVSQSVSKQVGNSRELKDLERNLSAIEKEFQKIERSKAAHSIHTMSESLEQFADRSGIALKRFLAFTVATTGVIKLASEIRQAFGDAIKFEENLVKVSQVSERNLKQLNSLRSSILDVSRAVGTSAVDLSDATLTIAQAGLPLNKVKEAMEAIAKANVSPTFGSSKESAEALIATISQFKNEATNLEAILSKINFISAKEAVESQDLVDAIQRGGGAAALAGTKFNEYLSIITAVRATTRESADQIATGIRTITANIASPATIEFFRKKYKVDIAPGDKVDDLVTAIDKIKTRLGQLGELPTIKDIIDPETGKITQELTNKSVAFSEALEKLGGKRNQSRLIPLFTELSKIKQLTSSFDEVDPLTGLKKSENTFANDVQKSQAALQRSIDSTKTAFLQLGDEILKNEGTRGLIELFLGVSRAIADTTKEVVKLSYVLAPIFAPMVARGIGTFARAFSPSRLFGAPSQFRAHGGEIFGNTPGDSVPCMLTPGEVVLNKSQQQNLGRVMGTDPKNVFGKIGVPGFASGGKVQIFAKGGKVTKDDVIKELDRLSKMYGVPWNEIIAGVYEIDENKQRAFKTQYGGRLRGAFKRDERLIGFSDNYKDFSQIEHEFLHALDYAGGSYQSEKVGSEYHKIAISNLQNKKEKVSKLGLTERGFKKQTQLRESFVDYLLNVSPEERVYIARGLGKGITQIANPTIEDYITRTPSTELKKITRSQETQERLGKKFYNVSQRSILESAGPDIPKDLRLVDKIIRGPKTRKPSIVENIFSGVFSKFGNVNNLLNRQYSFEPEKIVSSLIKNFPKSLESVESKLNNLADNPLSRFTENLSSGSAGRKFLPDDVLMSSIIGGLNRSSNIKRQNKLDLSGIGVGVDSFYNKTPNITAKPSVFETIEKKLNEIPDLLPMQVLNSSVVGGAGLIGDEIRNLLPKRAKTPKMTEVEKILAGATGGKYAKNKPTLFRNELSKTAIGEDEIQSYLNGEESWSDFSSRYAAVQKNIKSDVSQFKKEQRDQQSRLLKFIIGEKTPEEYGPKIGKFRRLFSAAKSKISDAFTANPFDENGMTAFQAKLNKELEYTDVFGNDKVRGQTSIERFSDLKKKYGIGVGKFAIGGKISINDSVDYINKKIRDFGLKPKEIISGIKKYDTTKDRRGLAAFDPKNKVILLKNENLIQSIDHEIGHAIDSYYAPSKTIYDIPYASAQSGAFFDISNKINQNRESLETKLIKHGKNTYVQRYETEYRKDPVETFADAFSFVGLDLQKKIATNSLTEKDIEDISNRKDIIRYGLNRRFRFAHGGTVPGSGHGDTVPALLSPGEVVLNKRQQGKLDQLTGSSAALFKAAGVPGFNTGGVIGKVATGLAIGSSLLPGIEGFGGVKDILEAVAPIIGTVAASFIGLRSAFENVKGMNDWKDGLEESNKSLEYSNKKLGEFKKEIDLSSKEFEKASKKYDAKDFKTLIAEQQTKVTNLESTGAPQEKIDSAKLVLQRLQNKENELASTRNAAARRMNTAIVDPRIKENEKIILQENEKIALNSKQIAQAEKNAKIAAAASAVGLGASIFLVGRGTKQISQSENFNKESEASGRFNLAAGSAIGGGIAGAGTGFQLGGVKGAAIGAALGTVSGAYQGIVDADNLIREKYSEALRNLTESIGAEKVADPNQIAEFSRILTEKYNPRSSSLEGLNPLNVNQSGYLDAITSTEMIAQATGFGVNVPDGAEFNYKLYKEDLAQSQRAKGLSFRNLSNVMQGIDEAAINPDEALKDTSIGSAGGKYFKNAEKKSDLEKFLGKEVTKYSKFEDFQQQHGQSLDKLARASNIERDWIEKKYKNIIEDKESMVNKQKAAIKAFDDQANDIEKFNASLSHSLEKIKRSSIGVLLGESIRVQAPSLRKPDFTSAAQTQDFKQDVRSVTGGFGDFGKKIGLDFTNLLSEQQRFEGVLSDIRSGKKENGLTATPKDLIDQFFKTSNLKETDKSVLSANADKYINSDNFNRDNIRAATDAQQIFSDSAENYKKVLNPMTEATIEATNRLLDFGSKVSELRDKAEDLRKPFDSISQILDIRGQSRELTADQVMVAQRQSESARTIGETGGLTAAQLRSNILGGDQRLQGLQKKLDVAQNAQERASLVQQITAEEAARTKATKGLEFLANSTQELSVVQQQLQKAESDRMNKRSLFETLAFGSSDDRFSARRNIQRLNSGQALGTEGTREVVNFLRQFGETSLKELGINRQGTASQEAERISADFIRKQQGQFGLNVAGRDLGQEILQSPEQKKLGREAEGLVKRQQDAKNEQANVLDTRAREVAQQAFKEFNDVFKNFKAENLVVNAEKVVLNGAADIKGAIALEGNVNVAVNINAPGFEQMGEELKKNVMGQVNAQVIKILKNNGIPVDRPVV